MASAGASENDLILILEHLLPFGAVFTRMTGLFLIAPIISSTTIPNQIKVLLALALSLAVYPTIPHHANVPLTLSLVSLAPVVIGELLIGATIGYIAALPILSVQMGGRMIGQQMGLSLANVFNPAVDDEVDVIGQILLFIAMASFLAVGGLEIIHFALVSSFEAVPLGGFGIERLPLETVVGLVSSGMGLAVRIAAPVLCVLMLEMTLSGFLMKTVPQINILSFGFPLKILAGVTMLLASLLIVHQAISDEISSALLIVRQWVESLSLPPSSG